MNKNIIELGIWKVLPSIKLLLDAIQTGCMSKISQETDEISDIDEDGAISEEQIIRINKKINASCEGIMDWYGEFSTKFLSIMLGTMIAVFAYNWYNLLDKDKIVYNQILLWIALILSFVYIANEIIRFYIISQSMRNLNKLLHVKINDYNNSNLRSSFEETESYLNQIYNIRMYFHDITWYCVNFQLLLFVMTIVDMGVFLILSYIS